LPNKEANKNEAEPDAEQKKESDQKTSLPDSMPVE
jgi:hypothetical protein